MALVIPYIDTKVSVEKTVAEIEAILQVHGANAIMKEFESGRIKSLAFKHEDIPFQLPVNVDAVYQYLHTKKTTAPGTLYRYYAPESIKRRWHEQAERCAWRNVMFSIKGMLAMVEIGMVTVTEVFLGYMLMDGEETLYQRMLTQGLKALPEGRE